MNCSFSNCKYLPEKLLNFFPTEIIVTVVEAAVPMRKSFITSRIYTILDMAVSDYSVEKYVII